MSNQPNTARQLLGRALLILQEIGEEDLMMQIDAFLEKPESEPVGFIFDWESEEGKHYSSIKLGPGEPDDEDGVKIYNIRPVYTAAPDQSARIVELTETNNVLADALGDAEIKIAELEQQLAELQNKKAVLLSNDQIGECHNAPSWYEFARAIERFALENNGIKVGE